MTRAVVAYLVGYVALAFLLGADILLTVAYLVAGVFLLSRWWFRRVLRQLAVERDLVERAFPGDEVTVSLRLRNPSSLPVPWVELHESLPTALAMPPSHREVVSLAPGEERTVTYELRPSRRGYFPIGALNLRAGDLLGLSDHEMVAVRADRLIVYPDVVPLDRLGLPARAPLAAQPTSTPLFRDPSRITGVRPYQPGDAEREIHWTASATAGELLVKQHEPRVARDTLICLDLDQASYPVGRRHTAAELAVVVAASLAHHIIVREGQSVGLLTEAADPLEGGDRRFLLPDGARRSHLMAILEVLARVQVTRATPLARLLRESTVDLPWGATIAVVTGRVTEDLLDALYHLRRTGFAVAVLVAGPDEPDRRAMDRARSLGITAHAVARPRDLEAVT